MDKVPKKKTVSVYFSPALFCLTDFLTLKDSTDRLSQNTWYKITTLCCIISQTTTHLIWWFGNASFSLDLQGSVPEWSGS